MLYINLITNPHVYLLPMSWFCLLWKPVLTCLAPIESQALHCSINLRIPLHTAVSSAQKYTSIGFLGFSCLSPIILVHCSKHCQEVRPQIATCMRHCLACHLDVGESRLRARALQGGLSFQFTGVFFPHI